MTLKTEEEYQLHLCSMFLTSPLPLKGKEERRGGERRGGEEEKGKKEVE